jgi:hypothetical protein
MALLFAIGVSFLLTYRMLVYLASQAKEIKRQLERNRRPWE